VYSCEPERLRSNHTLRWYTATHSARMPRKGSNRPWRGAGSAVADNASTLHQPSQHPGGFFDFVQLREDLLHTFCLHHQHHADAKVQGLAGIVHAEAALLHEEAEEGRD